MGYTNKIATHNHDRNVQPRNMKAPSKGAVDTRKIAAIIANRFLSDLRVFDICTESALRLSIVST